ncbi:MAG: exosortase [Candidatus Eiseniibacteriota bacterium]|nr:MAG: exosortase [Candidatus Eisenbacteria bacterium]
MSRWKPLVLGILLLGLYGMPLVTLVTRWWEDSDYSHGFVVAAVCLFLGARARREEKASEGGALGLALLVPGLVLYLLGVAAAEIFSVRVSLLPVAAGVALLLVGRERGFALLFPIGFFFFAIPLPQVLYFTLTSPLQTLAAQMGTWMATSVGVVALRDGNIVRVGEVSLGVAEACSGLRSLVAFAAVCVLLAKYLHRSWLARIVLVGAAVVVAVTSNALRLFLTCLGAVGYGPQFVQGWMHPFLGIVTFVGGVLVLVMMSEVLRWQKRKAST